jgi:glycosyltransferase involved in cell wall biosynthesis
MRVNKSPETSQANRRGSVCVVIAASDDRELMQRCLKSVRAQTSPTTPLLSVSATASEVNLALAHLAPADVVVLTEPCDVTAGWLERLRVAAREDTNTATASALADAGTALALGDHAAPQVAVLADCLAEHTLGLHPRLSRAVTPCVYLRREALELVGPLDNELDLRSALEIDFAQRCVLCGLAHVAADDVVVQRLAPAPAGDGDEPQEAGAGGPARLLERYPYLSQTSLAQSGVLARALQAARGPQAQLGVTLDARALGGAVTGTQVHILELAFALARTGALRLRLLVWRERIDSDTLEQLSGMPATEVLAVEDVDPATAQTTVFHRAQQTFSPADLAFAHDLGERIVLSQLDLIAYRNPGYFADAAAWEDYRRASRHGLSAADRVVVFSDHTRQELLSDALVEEARVRVVPPGLDHRSAAEPHRPRGLGAGWDPSAGGGLLLCLGTDFRHKNRVFALRLLASLRDEHDWHGRLVLAGTHIPHGSSQEIERAFLDEHDELRDAVVQLGPVSEPEKAWLMAHADAVVYPSVYEGFGLVPFESALSGVPCLFAPQSSLAETVSKDSASILPWDPTESAAAAHALLTDEKARTAHVRSLAAASRSLTWDATASAMIEVYREAAVAPVRDGATLSRDAVARERTLTGNHETVAQMLIDEREHVLRDYNELIEELGPGRGLVGADGTLPEDVQHALLALSARPALSRPLFRMASYAFVLARAVSRALRRVLGRSS